MPHKIDEVVGPWIDAAIDKHALGEKVVWESALLVGQHQEPIFTVFVWVKGAVLGTCINGSFQVVDPLSVEEAWIDGIMSRFLEELRQARSAQVQQAAQEATAGPQRGSQRPSGLLVP